MVKLILMVLLPFYAIWGVFNYLFFFNYPIEWSVIVLVCGLFAWGTGFIMLLNQRQMEAGRYQCFRELCWRMSVTQRIKGDIYVDQKIEYIGELRGFQIYKPHFPFAIPYKHPVFNDGKGIIFDDAYWLLPDKWEQTFFPVADQEAWFGAIPVSVKAEDTTLHNLRWALKEGKFTPIALVVDSNRHFEATLGRVALQEKESALFVAQYLSQIANLTKENIQVRLELASEVQANRGLLAQTTSQEELVRERVEDIKKRHSDIKRMPTPWRFPKVNWRLLLFGLLIFGGIVTFVWLITTFW